MKTDQAVIDALFFLLLGFDTSSYLFGRKEKERTELLKRLEALSREKTKKIERSISWAKENE